MSNQLVLSQQKGSILEIEIDRPDKMNALTDAMYASLVVRLQSAENDPSIKVILIKARGKHFCAGNDLADFLKTEFSFDSNVVQFLVALAQLQKPIIAAVNGAAIGIGTTMLLHCDLVYASSDTTFSLPFIKLGLTPEGGSTQLLAQRCGAAKANDWLLTGRNIFADEALQSGLINKVFESAEICHQEASDSAVCLSKRSLELLLETKKLLKGGQVNAVVQQIKKEAEVFSGRLRSQEAQSAFKSFLAR